MRIKKIILAQLAKQLVKKKLVGKYGEYEAYLVTGSTIPIKESLKALGFSWDGREVAWRISANKMSESIKQRLKELGVVDNTSGMGATVTPPVSPSMTNPLPPVKEENKKTWVTEDEELTRWYGFPINKDILRFDVETEVDGTKYTANIRVDRSVTWGGDTYQKRKSRDEKGFPRYLIHMEIPELNEKETSARKSKVKWGEYPEEELLNKIKEDYTNAISKRDFSVVAGLPIKRFFYGIEIANDVRKRTPEYIDFLKTLVSKYADVPTNYPKYQIRIDDGDYKGDYYVLPIVGGGDNEKIFSASLVTSLDRTNAPHKEIVGKYDGINLYHTYTIQDFHNRVKEYINANLEEIKEDYVKYLKSFPYLEDQVEKEGEIAEKIKGYILSGGGNGWEDVLRVLQDRGLIRPHRRQKQGLGLTMGDEIRWVLDDEKIRNGIYGRGYGLNSPGYFYDAVAYFILREIRNIRSFTDMMLMDSFSTVKNILNRMGNNFRMGDIEKTIYGIGNKIINKIQGATENKQDKKVSVPASNADLIEFFNFAKGLGVPEDDLDSDNAKSIYRALARKLHPDMEMDASKKGEAEEKFKKLQEIWDRVPNTYKNAFSWYGIYRES